MSNVPWNNQGTQTVYMSGIGGAFQGLGYSLNQYWNGRDHFYNPDNGGTWYDQGQRAMSSWTNKSWTYIYGQGTYVGAPNGYTSVYVNQGQGGCYQSVYWQIGYIPRVFIRNYTYTTGYGGTGGRILQGYPFNPGASPGTPAFNIQGTAGYLIVRYQGFTLAGGGGGGGAGQQGSVYSYNAARAQGQYQTTGGGGGGGGGGFGIGGARPDAGRQGGTSQNGFATSGGAGGANGGSGAYTGGSGGSPGQGGASPPGGGYVGGGAAGQNVAGGWQGSWIY